MSIIKTLNRAILLELKFSECYEHMSQMASEPSLIEDFKKLSQEENYHANLIKSGDKILSISSDPWTGRAAGWLRTDSLIGSILRWRGRGPSLRDSSTGLSTSTWS